MTIDWNTTTISAGSFLLHFVLLGALYSDWCDPVVDDDETAVATVVTALKTLAPLPPIDEPELVDLQEAVPEPVRPPQRPFVPMDPGWGVEVMYFPVDQPTDPDWSDLDALTLTDPANATVVKRAKAARAALDATLRGFGSRTRGAASPKGNAAIQSPSVTGGVSNAARVVAGMRAGFRACYQRGLKGTPDATGSIRLTLRVGAGGQVMEATPVASGNLSEVVTSCVTARARAALFAAPDEGSAVIEVPVTFMPGRSARQTETLLRTRR